MRSKKEYPADKRKAQEMLTPTQAAHTENTIKDNDLTQDASLPQNTFLPFRCFHATGAGKIMSPVHELNNHFTKLHIELASETISASKPMEVMRHEIT